LGLDFMVRAGALEADGRRGYFLGIGGLAGSFIVFAVVDSPYGKMSRTIFAKIFAARVGQRNENRSRLLTGKYKEIGDRCGGEEKGPASF